MIKVVRLSIPQPKPKPALAPKPAIPKLDIGKLEHSPPQSEPVPKESEKGSEESK